MLLCKYVAHFNRAIWHTSINEFGTRLCEFGSVVRGESPGSRLISTASMFEETPPSPLTGEQYGNMEPK